MSRCLGSSFSWTSCTDSGCVVHASEKEGSGWYPQLERRRSWADEMDYEQDSSGGEVGADLLGDGSVSRDECREVKGKTVEDT